MPFSLSENSKTNSEFILQNSIRLCYILNWSMSFAFRGAKRGVAVLQSYSIHHIIRVARLCPAEKDHSSPFCVRCTRYTVFGCSEISAGSEST